MVHMSSIYTVNNLPPGFYYQPTQKIIFSPVNQKFAIVRDDGTVKNGCQVVFENVNEYVTFHLLMDTKAFKNRRDRISEPYRTTYVAVPLPLGKSCLMKSEDLWVIMCIAASIILMVTLLPTILLIVK